MRTSAQRHSFQDLLGHNQQTCQQHNGLTRLVVNLNDRAGWTLYSQVSLRTDSPKKTPTYLWAGLVCVCWGLLEA